MSNGWTRSSVDVDETGDTRTRLVGLEMMNRNGNVLIEMKQVTMSRFITFRSSYSSPSFLDILYVLLISFHADNGVGMSLQLHPCPNPALESGEIPEPGKQETHHRGRIGISRKGISILSLFSSERMRVRELIKGLFSFPPENGLLLFIDDDGMDERNGKRKYEKEKRSR